MNKEKDKFNKDWDSEWENHWKKFLITKGKFNEQKIKNEMHDLVFCYTQVGKVYQELTGGLLSKHNYYADTIITKYEEEIEDAYDRGYADAEEEFNPKNKL